MEQSSKPGASPALPALSAANSVLDAGRRLSALSSLLANLDESPAAADKVVDHENRLVQVRLGMASSLFFALRAKHPPTAAHCLRVALGCSSWAHSLNLASELRDEIEVAALLHDVGKIAVPDRILTKPAKLTPEEGAAVDTHRRHGAEILAGCAPSQRILDIVEYAGAWYDGSRAGFERTGEDLPLGARMVAIVDAFDAMTTDHVYRRAHSRERAVAELFEGAGGQFDPQLVGQFCSHLGDHQVRFGGELARRWLQELESESSNGLWQRGGPLVERNGELVEAAEWAYHRRLLETMHDAVVFINSDHYVLIWNRAAERLTGILSSSVQFKLWSPDLIQLCDERDELITEEHDPVSEAMRTGTQLLRRLRMAGRDGRVISIDAHIAPVLGKDGAPIGATLLLHDASSQITLEERVQTLHEKATRDPLTRVANRAEFDRVHKLFVSEHLERDLPCALIICDIDFFKRINDTHGHQAGDEALVSFAGLLRRFHRTGDLVARYGGEEFVMLCTDCDNATATERAEQLRRELANMPQPSLSGKCMTASFGVTEVQPGDTPETMLRRADRALLQAKDLGRNTVVQLGAGMSGRPVEQAAAKGWLSWLLPTTPGQLIRQQLITSVPLKMAAEKLRGFVADHHAQIVSIDENQIILNIDTHEAVPLRRQEDRPVPFHMELHLTETVFQEPGRAAGVRTLIDVMIRPRKNRDRRRRDVLERARQLVASIKSYLMAHEHTGNAAIQGVEDGEQGMLDRAIGIFSPLFSSDSASDDDDRYGGR